MFPAAMSNSTSLSEEASVSSGTRVQDFGGLNPVLLSTISPQQPHKMKKKRNLSGNPDPDAEVIALSPKTLMATNRFVCEICNKGFQRDQNLQLHRRGHNLPWKLKQRNSKEVRKRAYVCPEPSCVHHHPSRALGDLTGIKKHYCRKHGEKKWKCDKCSKIYAVQSDWKAHSKTCGTREYRCDCGTLFSRKDSFITHRAFCDALAEESARLSANPSLVQPLFPFPTQHISLTPWDPPQNPNPNPNPVVQVKAELAHHFQAPNTHNSTSNAAFLFQEAPVPQQHPKAFIPIPTVVPFQPSSSPATSAHLSATALLQKAATVGHMTRFDNMRQQQIDQQVSHMGGFTSGEIAKWHNTDHLTRDFLGLTDSNGDAGDVGHGDFKDMLTFTGGVQFEQQPPYERDQSLLKPHGFGFAEASSETWGGLLR